MTACRFASSSNARWVGVLQCSVIMFLCILISSTNSCFIRNCPLGGKRALESHPSAWHTKRTCLQCGPEGLGQCIGPRICCGPQIGCYMNTAETAICEAENDNPMPCEIKGEECGPNGDGRCVSSGMCCTDEKCTLDAMCENVDFESPFPSAREAVNSLDQVLQQSLNSRQAKQNPIHLFLERLLHSDNYAKK